MLQFNVRKIVAPILIIALVFGFVSNGYAQSSKNNRNKAKKEHSAHKATIYSFILPNN